jgi:hypothetical protein
MSSRIHRGMEKRCCQKETCQVLADIDEGGVRTMEITEALGFGETTVRKLLTG